MVSVVAVGVGSFDTPRDEGSIVERANKLSIGVLKTVGRAGIFRQRSGAYRVFRRFST